MSITTVVVIVKSNIALFWQILIAMCHYAFGVRDGRPGSKCLKNRGFSKSTYPDTKS